MKQLRFSTTKPMAMLGIMNPVEDHEPLSKPKKIGYLVVDKIKGRSAYIHGQAEVIAGYDIPVFLDGNLGQLELPVNQQDILMLLPSGKYKCKAEYNIAIGRAGSYLITLMTEPSVFD